MAYDIGKLETRKTIEDGKDFQIVHPLDGPAVDDDGMPVTINLSGAESSRIKAAVRERQKIRKKQAEDTGKPIEYDFQMQLDDQIEDLVTLTNGWSGNMVRGGEPFPFSKANAESLYRNSPDIMEWATEKVTRRINFLPTSSKK
jgi:hypothetical protein